jgi:predicted ATPase
MERARLLIEEAEALGEPPDDPLLLFSVLYGFWAANFVAYDDVCVDLAAQFLRLAEKQGATVPLMVGHRNMGVSLTVKGDISAAREHLNFALSLYDPLRHRSLATRFAVDIQVAVLSYRSLTLWMLGYPEAALTDAKNAVRNGRETGQAASLMFALYVTGFVHILRGDYSIATALARELFALAEEKSAFLWKRAGMIYEGCVLTETGKPSEGIEMLTAGIAEYRSTGATTYLTFFLSSLTRAYAEIGQFDDAWRCIREAMTAIETTNERWSEAEINRVAGEIALMSPEPDAATAQTCFERALAVARKEQAKYWELRAAMSMARLWRDQGKRDEARDLLAPVYGWFTEGFDTLDLKEAKALLEELAS